MADKKTKSATQDKKTASNPSELNADLKAALEKRVKLEFQHNVAPLKNPMELRELRREIARIKTRLAVKEAAK
jgi:large subunit ribosomal protein L29